MLIGYKRGQGSIVIRVVLLDSSVSTGAGKTGLTSSSSGLIIAAIADNESTTTAYAQASSNVESITTLGTYAAPTSGKCRFKEVDATNHPGLYEIQLADARYAVSSAKSLTVSISGVSNLAQTHVNIPLRDLDPYDSVRAGLTALPNAAAEAAGGLFTRGTGAGQINQDANGRIDANVTAFGGTAGTFSGGRPEVNATHWRGSALSAPTVAGVPAVEVIDISSAGASDIRAAVGLATANLDTQFSGVPTSVWGVTLDVTSTAKTMMRGIAAAAYGEASGLATTSVTYRNPDDTVDALVGTVDADGNRSTVTENLTY